MEPKSKDITSDKTSDIFSQQSGELHINSFPNEILKRILKYFSFGEIAKFRSVSKLFNRICGDILNSEFYRLKTAVQVRYTYVKSQMPRRESSRRKHILSRENDIVETLHMRLALLNLTVGKHVERNHCCFFAGEVLDEVNRLLTYVKKTLYLNRPFKVTDELFDLSTMAVEYFKEHIEPTLPEVIYFSDFIGNSLTSPFKPSTCTATEISQASGNQAESTPSLNELNASLENTRRIVYRNRMNITSIKSSVRALYQNIDNIEAIVHQIKKGQKDCKELDLPKNCLNELLFQLNQCSLMIDSFTSHLSKSQGLNKVPSFKQIETYKFNSQNVHSRRSTRESSNCLQVSCDKVSDSCKDDNLPASQSVSFENLDHTNEISNINNESVASTSTVCNKRKINEDISENLLKKRKT